ncbi:MAG: hypothetical protein MZV65_37450 [Chromatiales bacterium]|nr:hypothetical protein [Chromatiales bacterium]
MPFREATALVTVEREGVIDVVRDHAVRQRPRWCEVPLKGHYAPNVFVSVLAVRGRVGRACSRRRWSTWASRPSSSASPRSSVGWKAHELKVEVQPERRVYQVRDQARVTHPGARTADGAAAGRTRGRARRRGRGPAGADDRTTAGSCSTR